MRTNLPLAVNCKGLRAAGDPLPLTSGAILTDRGSGRTC